MAPSGRPGGRGWAAGAWFGDGLPDQLGDVEDQIRGGLTRLASIANLTDAYADHVVEPAVGLAVGHVRQRAYDLAAPRRVGAPIPVPLNHDRGSVVGLNDGPEVGAEGPIRALLPGEVGSAETAGYRALAAPFSDEEHLLPAAAEADRPALRIGEADAIQRFKPHQQLPRKS